MLLFFLIDKIFIFYKGVSTNSNSKIFTKLRGGFQKLIMLTTVLFCSILKKIKSVNYREKKILYKIIIFIISNHQ